MKRTPQMDATTLLLALKHRADNPLETKEEAITWSRQKFPSDQFIHSEKFVTWIGGGKGSMVERELHVSLMRSVSLANLAAETQQALEDREQALIERDEAREKAEQYRGQAEDARFQLALMSSPPEKEPVGV